MPKHKKDIAKGKLIIPNDVFPEPHELNTARVFTAKGFDVEFLVPSRTPGQHTPDVVMNGVAWEMKSPTGRSRATLDNQFKRAALQSENLIIDFRRCKMSESDFTAEVGRQWESRRSFKRITIVLCSGATIDYRR